MDSSQCLIQLSARPTRGLMDEKMTVLVQKAPPGLQLTVRGLHLCEDGHSWEAFGHYISDATGAVDTSQHLSLGGTYSGVEPMGLLWSLKVIPGSKPGLRLRKMNVQTPLVLTVSVYQGHHTEGFADLVPLAAVEVERWYIAPGVRRVDVTEDGLTAALFLPPGPGPFPGVLDLWGGAGKLVENRAALLASHGFAAMALDYFTPRITLETGKMVGNDYFERAFQVLEKHPQVLGDSIAMVGLSFGTSVALKMAAYSQVVKLGCVVCISGSHVQPVDGTVEDMVKYFHKNIEKTRESEAGEKIWRNLLLPIPTDPQFKVDVGRIRCPVLLIFGDDDQNWPTPESSVDMKEMMSKAGNAHLLTVLSYPKAGHLIEPPYSPLTRSSAFRSVNTREKVIGLWGGETHPHSLAQEDAWQKMLLFLREHLHNRHKAAPGPAHL